MSDNPSGEEFRAVSSTQSSSPKNNNGLWIVLGCLGGGGLSVVFLGIVMAISLPSFLNQANRAKQTEAQTYVRAMSRAQQAEFIENGAFTPSMGKLQLGLGDSTIYRYGLEVEPSGTHVLITATPLTDPIRSLYRSGLYGWRQPRDHHHSDANLRGFGGIYGCADLQSRNGRDRLSTRLDPTVIS